ALRQFSTLGRRHDPASALDLGERRGKRNLHEFLRILRVGEERKRDASLPNRERGESPSGWPHVQGLKMKERHHSGLGAERPRRLWNRLSWYVLGQLLGPVALLTLLMTCVILLTQSLKLLDLVINRGQSAPTFIYLTFLILPGLLVIIVPIAFFFGSLFTLSRLAGDSELVVMSSAGYSQRQLAMPVFVAALVVMVVTWICSLWLMPAGQRALNAKVLDIRADIGAALLNEGEFNVPTPGLTVFIRLLGNDGQIRGIMVHDSRDAKRPVTYMAERGQLAQTPLGTRLIMQDGTMEQSAQGGSQLSVLKFKRYVFDLDQFGSTVHA